MQRSGRVSLRMQVIRGLVVDKENGNLVKADHFGYVKRAMHGTEMISTQAMVDRLDNSTIAAELAPLDYKALFRAHVEGQLASYKGPLQVQLHYLHWFHSLFLEGVSGVNAVGKALFRAHVEGQLKSEIMSQPEKFVEHDPELPLALLDQKEAGKKLLLITNSDYHYTDKMMHHSFNRFLPQDDNQQTFLHRLHTFSS